MSDPTATFATPRIAAGALFVHGDRIVLVHKTHGNGWDIPGGYAEIGESPAAACLPAGKKWQIRVEHLMAA